MRRKRNNQQHLAHYLVLDLLLKNLNVQQLYVNNQLHLQLQSKNVLQILMSSE